MTSPTIKSCEDALRVLAAYLDGELEDRTGDEVEMHLALCRSCYSRAEFEKQLREKLQGGRRMPVRPELRERIQTLIERFPLARTEDGSQ